MPTYEYECTRCGLVTSEFKPMSAPRRQRCPSCRSKVELLISGGLGVHFKGDGFYINDSRKGSRAAGAGPKAEAKDGPKAGGEKPAGAPKQDASPAGTVHDSGKGAKDKD